MGLIDRDRTIDQCRQGDESPGKTNPTVEMGTILHPIRHSIPPPSFSSLRIVFGELFQRVRLRTLSRPFLMDRSLLWQLENTPWHLTWCSNFRTDQIPDRRSFSSQYDVSLLSRVRSYKLSFYTKIRGPPPRVYKELNLSTTWAHDMLGPRYIVPNCDAW